MTLIEVLISALVMTIGGVSMLMSFVYCQRAIIESTNRYNASLIINKHFEELARWDTETGVQDYIDEWNKSTCVKEVGEGSFKTYTVEFTTSNIVNPTASTDLSMITATVFWDSVEGPKHYSMSILTNEPG